MSWIGSYNEYNKIRSVLYNNTVFLTKTQLNYMVSKFDTIFNSFINFTDEIASIKLMPISIRGDVSGKLKTARGTTDVECFHAYNDNYFYLGESFLRPHFNNFADYKGYTQIKAYLPFLGFIDIDPNIFMNSYIQFRMTVDYYSGKGLYIIGRTDTHSNPTTHKLGNPYRMPIDDVDMEVIYTYETDIGIDIPIGVSNFGDIVRNIALGTIKTAIGVGTSIYTNTLPLPTITKYTSTESRGRVRETKTTTTSIKEPSSNWLTPVAEAVNGSIDVLNRLNVSGNSDRVTGSASTWDIKGEIKIIYYRPKMVPINSNFLNLYGKPLGSVELLNDMVGYTEVSSVHIRGEDFDNATKSELENLNNILLGGVIFDDYIYGYNYTLKEHLPELKVYAHDNFNEGFKAYNTLIGNEKTFKGIQFLSDTINLIDFNNEATTIGRTINGVMNFDLSLYNKFTFPKSLHSKEFMECFGYYFSIA